MNSKVKEIHAERIDAFDGMKINAEVWNRAHEFHLLQQRLHGLKFHGAGIANGLDVFATHSPARSVVIVPGAAIDRNGAVISIPDTQAYTFTSRRKGTLYLNLQYREVAVGDGGSDGLAGTGRSRLRQAFRIQESETPGGELDIELARVEIEGEKTSIQDAVDPTRPGAGEIDMGYRQYAGSHVRGEIATGRLLLGDREDSPGDAPLRHLAGHINQSTPYRAYHAGNLGLGDKLEQCDLLYFSGEKKFEIADEESKNLADFIEQGGTLWGEGSRRGSKDEFGLAFDKLARDLGGKLEQVGGGHPLLTSHYVFSEPPVGAAESGVLMIADGLIYSGFDYGRAWNGCPEGKNLEREIIRSALEFSTNIAVFAGRRSLRHRAVISE